MSKIKKQKTIPKAQIIGIIIAAIIGLSGWITFYYNYISNQPKITGRLFTVIVGQWKDKNLTSFLCYAYLVNERKAAVHLLDYELEVDFGEGYKKLKKAYGLDNPKNFTFLDKNRSEIIIPDFQKQLINKKDNLAQYGIPIHGFILFVGDSSYYSKTVKVYRLTCIDAFGNRHTITTNPGDFGNLYLLQDMTGMRFPN